MTDRLMTTRELQQVLKLDRVTIYRMVKDGELPARRVGGQWRFSAAAINEWLAAPAGKTEPQPASVDETLQLADLIDLPTLQAIQNQFADLVGVAAFITNPDGLPLAACSRCSQFCRTVHSSEAGMAACQASWRSIAELDEPGAVIHICHAGIQYASAPVDVQGQRLGMVTAGQFFTEPPDAAEFRARAQQTAARIGVDSNALTAAMSSLKIVSEQQALQITALLQTIANALSGIGYQGYLTRQTLLRIAQLTAGA
ncbi:MAG: PocR ligand-binding domain-containing protein [Nitrosomonas ureae]